MQVIASYLLDQIDTLYEGEIETTQADGTPSREPVEWTWDEINTYDGVFIASNSTHIELLRGYYAILDEADFRFTEEQKRVVECNQNNQGERR